MLREYVGLLERRRADIVQRIDKISVFSFGAERNARLKSINDKLFALNKEDLVHPIGNNRIKSEL